MSDREHEGNEPEPESAPSRLDDDEMRSLLRKAMRVESAPAKPVLVAVQRKIRQRSAGKFFADGWSTSSSPKTTYFVTSIVMLIIVVALYFALVPGGWGRP